MNEIITIAVSSPEKWMAVECEIVGVFAIHETLYKWGSPLGCNLTVTHIPTGGAIETGIRNREKAIEIIEAISGLEYKGTKVVDMPTCDMFDVLENHDFGTITALGRRVGKQTSYPLRKLNGC